MRGCANGIARLSLFRRARSGLVDAHGFSRSDVANLLRSLWRAGIWRATVLRGSKPTPPLIAHARRSRRELCPPTAPYSSDSSVADQAALSFGEHQGETDDDHRRVLDSGRRAHLFRYAVHWWDQNLQAKNFPWRDNRRLLCVRIGWA